MNKKLFLLLLLLLLGCTPSASSPSPIPSEANTASPIPTDVQNLAPLRLAMLAEPTSANVWALWDKEGASYENYAIRGNYYPRLYRLAPPNNELIPLLAEGEPSPFIQEGEFYTSVVSLRANLQWSDTTPLTAEDVAFTINTALQFQLGLNWANFYPREKLHHAEAVNAETVKYYFASPPHIGEWQYGTLTGVFISHAYWQPKIAEIEDLLPQPEDDRLMESYQAEIDALQAEAETIAEYMKTLKEKSMAYRGQEQLLIDREVRRDSFKKKLALAQQEKREKLIAARSALYALEDDHEPLAGQWQPNLNTAFIENIAAAQSAHFKMVQYQSYPRDEALNALLNNEADLLLSPQGLTPQEIKMLAANPKINFVKNRRNDIRFLLFNPALPHLQDIALRRALACLIDPEEIAANVLEGSVVPALGWVHPENSRWYTGLISPPCAGLDADARLAAGTRTLKMAGYAWEQEPSPNHVGHGLVMPSGKAFPSMAIIAPQSDPSRVVAASHIAEKAESLGISVEVLAPNDEAFFYALYGSGIYDLALAGWQLSFFPDYLCAFFGADNPYEYQQIEIEKECDAFLSTNDFAAAREKVFKLEVLLWDDLPAMPLFSSKIIEAYQNFSLPFEQALGGFAPAFYGAPAYLDAPK